MLIKDLTHAYRYDIKISQVVHRVAGAALRMPQEVARLSYRDTEFCGVLLGDPALGCAWLELPNTAVDTRHRFAVGAEAIAAVMEVGLTFSGLWHTHPPIPVRSKLAEQLEAEDRSTGPRPSGLDLDYHPLSLRMLIWHLGVCREFNVQGEELQTWNVDV